MKKLLPFSIIFSLLWLGLSSLSGNTVFAQSTTLAVDGVYVPRMTKTQRDAIISPSNGQMIYNTDDECFNVYQKDIWQKLCGIDTQMGETWTRKADFGETTRNGAVGFSIGNKGYIGTGNINNNYLKDFWEYDPLTDIWTQKANFGGSIRAGAIGFSIGNKGYIGTGHDGSNYLKDFWQYNPLTNKWVQKADFNGNARNNARSFSIGSKGYIGIGYDGTNYLKDFWEYDSTSTANGINDDNTPKGKWTQKKYFRGAARNLAVGFSMGDKGYIGTGNSGAGLKKDFWEYNPATDEWVQKADFAGASRQGAIGFSINNKSYIGTGFIGTNYVKDFWEYDSSSTINGTDSVGNPKGSWVQKKDIDTGATSYAVGFSIGNKGYIGTGFTGNSFWEYNPNGTNLTQQGNNFNGNSQLVQTNSLGKIPNTILPTNITIQSNTFNGSGQLVKTDGNSKIFLSVLPDTVTRQGNQFNKANQLTKLNNSGFLGIEVATPKAQIHLKSEVANKKIILWGEADNGHQFYGFGVNDHILRYQVDNLNSAHVFYAGENATNSTELFRIKGTGGACLNGNIVTTGASCTSDIRYKRNLSSIENPLTKVLQMNGFYYFWKTEQFREKNFSESRQIGFIAQEVEQLFPELVNTDEKGYKSVDYARLTPILVEAIKELKKENDNIRKDVEILKNLVLQTQSGK